MQDITLWIDKITGIVGVEGEIIHFSHDAMQHRNSFRQGEKWLFYLGLNQWISYPAAALTEQAVSFIELLISQVAFPREDALNWDKIFHNIVEGKPTSLIVEQVMVMGFDPAQAYLPMTIEMEKDVSESMSQVIDFYFQGKATGSIISRKGYFLIPLRALSLEMNDQDALEELGRGFSDLMKEEGMDGIRLAFTPCVERAEQWFTSFELGKKVCTVGRKFDPTKQVYFSWNMDLELLLADLPTASAKRFVRNLLGDESMASFNQEIYSTLQVLLRENLNVSETARKLYIHRNTLLYRIERFKQETGKDVRNGRDAYMVHLALTLCKGFQSD